MSEGHGGSNLVLGFVVFSVLAAAGSFLYNTVYKDADGFGYMPHEAQTSIAVPSNWAVGELKTCESIPLTTDLSIQMHRPDGYAFNVLDCVSPEQHAVQMKVFDVRFYGREQQPEYRSVQWQCKRYDGSDKYPFQCKQIGGLRLESRPGY
jgi:uncharacterized lipoprotein YmbA